MVAARMANLKHGVRSDRQGSPIGLATPTRARVDHRQLVDLGLVLTVVIELTVVGYRWMAQNRVIKR
jgi:hypothetical protein